MLLTPPAICSAMPVPDALCPIMNVLAQQARAISMNARAYLDICNSSKNVTFGSLVRSVFVDLLRSQHWLMSIG